MKGTNWHPVIIIRMNSDQRRNHEQRRTGPTFSLLQVLASGTSSYPFSEIVEFQGVNEVDFLKWYHLSEMRVSRENNLHDIPFAPQDSVVERKQRSPYESRFSEDYSFLYGVSTHS